MAFDQETAEMLAPVLAMIGQESRLDPHWTCQMLEAVNEQVLPEFHRQQRDAAASDAERIRCGLKLTSGQASDIDDSVQLAHSYANDERLFDALCWVTKALELQPADGELLRFKASILERMGWLEPALQIAQEAARHDADPVLIAADIERISCRHAAHVEAMAEQHLPRLDRQKRDAATSIEDRIRHGLRLASSLTVEVDDLVMLAHDYANGERLTDALHWIGKAIELRPAEGELLRFEASILERIGKFEEALRTAHKAKFNNADPASIANDIDRINERNIALLREASRSLDDASSLPAFAKLLGTGSLEFHGFMKFVGKILKSYAKRK